MLSPFLYFRNFDFLIPDAPELIHNFLEQEGDASCKRNAFMMLIHVDQVWLVNLFCMIKDWILLGREFQTIVAMVSQALDVDDLVC